MQLQPKFNPKSTPYMMLNNRPTQVQITGVKFFLGFEQKAFDEVKESKNKRTEYSILYLTKELYGQEIDESELFETKEALLATL